MFLLAIRVVGKTGCAMLHLEGSEAMRQLSLVRGGMIFALLASFLVFGSSDYSYAGTPAAGSCSQATGSWICNVQDQNLSFNETASITQGGAGNHIDPANGEAVVYKNVFTDGSVVINARLTVTEKSDEIRIDKYDAGVNNLGIWTSVGSGTDDDTNTSFTIEFFEASSGEGVRLLNVEILVKDLDGADAEEFAAAWGLNSYVVTTDTVLDVATVDPVPVANPTTSNPGAENPTPETGVRQFLNEDKVSASSAINTPDQEAWVGMKFDSVLSIRIEAGGRDSGSGLIGFEFTDIDAAFTDATQEISVVDASYTVTYDHNNNPCGTAVPSPTTFTGAQSLSQGTEMSGAGVNLLSWNTKADGTGVTYALGSSYTAVDDITLYAQWSGAPCPPLFGGCDFDNRTTADGLGHNIQLGVYVDGDRVYAATNDGLSISTEGGKAGSFTNYTTANGLGNNKSRGAFIDGSVLYVPTQGGLSISTSLDNSDVSAGRFTTRTVANSTLGNNYTRRAVVVDSKLYVGTNGGLSISTNGGNSFTNRTTVDGLGHNAVWDVHVAGTNVYAATEAGLSISTNSGDSFTNKTTVDGLGHNFTMGIYVVGSTVYAATNGGLSISTNGGDSFTNRTTANGLGHNAVWDVHVAGTNVYAATSGGLSISTDSGATFRNLTTSNGLGDNELRAVYASGSTVYAATQGGLSISATCGTISTISSDSGGGTDPGIFLNVAGPVGESAPETPIYYGGSNLPGGSQYVLTLSDVCSPSRVIATLAEGTIGVQGSLSSFTRPPPRSPGTYNVRLVVTHSNGLAWQLQSQVTIGASGEYTIISAPVGSHSAAVASPPSSAGCAAAVSSPASASASTPAPVVDPVASAGQCTTSGFGSYVQQADAKPFPSGEKIQLAPGKTVGSSGGDLVNLDVELLEDNAVFEGHCYEVNVASTIMGGETVITLTSGELTGVTGSGFRPGTRVDIFLLSEPTLLGSVVVYAEGDFSVHVSFIAGRIPSGSHTLQIQGVGYDGVVKIVNTGVWVENTPVVVPEGSVTWWWWLLIAALVIMFIIIFVRRWRNREAIY